MRLSQIGVSGLCSFCKGTIEGSPAGKDAEEHAHLGGYVRVANSGPGVFLCCRPDCISSLAELLADTILDSQLLKDSKGEHTRGLDEAKILNDVVAKTRARVALAKK